jgi:hypothetical protein
LRTPKSPSAEFANKTKEPKDGDRVLPGIYLYYLMGSHRECSLLTERRRHSGAQNYPERYNEEPLHMMFMFRTVSFVC